MYGVTQRTNGVQRVMQHGMYSRYGSWTGVRRAQLGGVRQVCSRCPSVLAPVELVGSGRVALVYGRFSQTVRIDQQCTAGTASVGLYGGCTAGYTAGVQCTEVYSRCTAGLVRVRRCTAGVQKVWVLYGGVRQVYGSVYGTVRRCTAGVRTLWYYVPYI